MEKFGDSREYNFGGIKFTFNDERTKFTVKFPDEPTAWGGKKTGMSCEYKIEDRGSGNFNGMEFDMDNFTIYGIKYVENGMVIRKDAL